MPGWRHRTIALGLGLIGATGLDRALRGIARGRGIVLMLHSVRPEPDTTFRPNASLEVTPEFLRQTLDVLAAEGFEFVSLDAVPERLQGGARAPFAAVTFDDGYRDNRDHALPVLAARGVPWTVFVTTEFAAGTGRLWWIELEQAVARLDEVRLPDPRGEIVLPARTTAEKARAFATLHARARAAASRRDLLDALDRLTDSAGLDPRAILRDHCLDWDELAALSVRPGVQIGAHAITHHALARLTPAEARREIVEGRHILRDRLGLPVHHLAYPYGDPGAAGSREFELARQAGFRTAVTTRPGHLSAQHAETLQALPRVAINGHFQRAAAVRTLASGVPFLSAAAVRRAYPGARRWQRSTGNTSLGPS